MNAVAVRRLRRLRAQLKANGETVFLATDPLTIRYLAGARDAAWALVTTRRAVVMPSWLGYEAARQNAVRPWKVTRPAANALQALLTEAGVRRIGFDSGTMMHAEVGRLRRVLQDVAVLVPLAGLIETCREVKDVPELDAIRRAGSISRAVGEQWPWGLREGMTEAEAAAAVDVRMRALGAEGPAFDTIVLFGARSALPHGVPGDRRLARGDLVLADFGARVDGYASDCTRTWCWRHSTARQRRVYRAVARAYAAGLAAVRPGAPAGQADAAARRALGGLRRRFMHGLGHGVGLEVHERPRLGSGEKTSLRPGMTVTVEPGVYLVHWGGIRLEDTCIVGKRGAESVTGAPAPDLPVVGPV